MSLFYHRSRRQDFLLAQQQAQLMEPSQHSQWEALTTLNSCCLPVDFHSRHPSSNVLLSFYKVMFLSFAGLAYSFCYSMLSRIAILCYSWISQFLLVKTNGCFIFKVNKVFLIPRLCFSHYSTVDLSKIEICNWLRVLCVILLKRYLCSQVVSFIYC